MLSSTPQAPYWPEMDDFASSSTAQTVASLERTVAQIEAFVAAIDTALARSATLLSEISPAATSTAPSAEGALPTTTQAAQTTDLLAAPLRRAQAALDSAEHKSWDDLPPASSYAPSANSPLFLQHQDRLADLLRPAGGPRAGREADVALSLAVASCSAELCALAHAPYYEEVELQPSSEPRGKLAKALRPRACRESVRCWSARGGPAKVSTLLPRSRPLHEFCSIIVALLRSRTIRQLSPPNFFGHCRGQG